MISESSSMVEIRNVHKSFGSLQVLKGVDFDVREGEVVTLIGRSGSGKSTLLRCINLLEKPDSGEIRVFGEDILHTKNVNAYRAKVGMCFQQFNLFRNMNVLQNEAGRHGILFRGRRLPDLRRPEAARCDRQSSLHGSQADAV